MKITRPRPAILSFEFPPMIGGEATYTFSLAESFSKIGQAVPIITSGLKGMFHDPDSRFNISYAKTIKTEPFKLFSFSKRAGKILSNLSDKGEINLVHQTYDYFHPGAARGLDLPVVATIHHPFIRERRFFKKTLDFQGYASYLIKRRIYFMEIMQKKLCRESSKLIAVSSFTARSLIEDMGIDEEKITVIPNGIDLEKFPVKGEDTPSKTGLGFCEGDVIFLFVGRLDYNKGIKTLLEAFRHLRQKHEKARLLIVGSGFLKGMVTDFIKKEGRGVVRLVENVHPLKLPGIYRASDVFVLPSEMEGFGIVLLEAMASGKPCIATRVGGVTDVVEDNVTGKIIPPANPMALADRMEQLMLDPGLRALMGKAGRKRAEKKFNFDIIAEKTREVYRSAVNNGRGHK